MCSFDSAKNFLIAAGAALGTALVSAGLAIAALVFVWTWWLAPLFTAIAAASIALAAFFVSLAQNQAYLYYKCMLGGESPTSKSKCWGAWVNYRNSSIALATTLGILAALAGGVAGGLMGWWSVPDITYIIGAVIVNIATITTMSLYLNALMNCLNSTKQ